MSPLHPSDNYLDHPYIHVELCHKRAYHTKGDAKRALKSVRKDARRGRGSVYLCGRCRFWHVTSQRQRRNQE